MKIRHILLMAAAFVGAAVSCKPVEEDLGDPRIELGATEMAFEEEAGKNTVTLVSTRAWKATDLADWVLVEPGSGEASLKDQTVTVSVLANDGKDRKCTITFTCGIEKAYLTVSQKGPIPSVVIPEGDGTQAKPYSASQAHAIAAALANGATTPSKVYVRGIVHKIASGHEKAVSDYGNGQFYISDDGESSDNDFYCFQVYYLGGKKFSSADQVKVGDDVIVYGQLTNYSGTCETVGKGASFVYSLNGKSEGGNTDVDYTKVPAKTVDEFIKAADKSNYYKLTGKVSGFSSQYCSFDLTDASGKIYVYSVDNKADWSDKIKDGGTVTLAGKYDYYSSKSQHEVVNAQILEFTMGVAQKIETEKVADALAASDADEVTLKNVIVVATSKVGYIVTDAAGKDYIMTYYKSDATETIPEVGDKVDITAMKGTYSSMAQLNDPKTTILSHNNTFTAPEAQDITVGFDTFTSSVIKHVTFTGKLTVSGNYLNVNVLNASKNIGAMVQPKFDVSEFSNVDNIVYDGYYIYTTSNKYIYLMLIEARRPAGDYFSVNPVALKVDAAGGTVSFKVSSNVAWTAASDNSEFTLDKASGTGEATVTVTCPENKAFESRTVKVTVSTEAGVGTKSYEVVINQAAAVDPDAKVLELTNEEIAASFAASTVTDNTYGTWTISSASGTWSGDMMTKKDTKFVQIRNTLGANLMTPEFTSAITKIEIVACATTSGKNPQTRNAYAVPVDTDLKTPDKETKYTDAVIAKAYDGPVTFSGDPNVEITGSMEFKTDGVKQCRIICKDGSLYIKSVKVYLKK